MKPRVESILFRSIHNRFPEARWILSCNKLRMIHGLILPSSSQAQNAGILQVLLQALHRQDTRLQKANTSKIWACLPWVFQYHPFSGDKEYNQDGAFLD